MGDFEHGWPGWANWPISGAWLCHHLWEHYRFDLDRTLLRGASGEVFAGAMRTAGLVGPDPVPGEHMLYRLFNVIGETLPSMALARQAVGLARGRSQAAVAAAADSVADEVWREGAARNFDGEIVLGRDLMEL